MLENENNRKNLQDITEIGYNLKNEFEQYNNETNNLANTISFIEDEYSKIILEKESNTNKKPTIIKNDK